MPSPEAVRDGDKIFSLRVRKADLERFERFAAAQERTVSQAIRHLMGEALREQERGEAKAA